MAIYSIGVDFGTLSARAVLVDVATGEIKARAEYAYPHKIMKELPGGSPLPADSAYAHPADYMTALQRVIAEVIKDTPAEEIRSIGLDATSCSVLPLGAGGMPLCFTEHFKNSPHAYIKLWKHHSAAPQATRLQQIAQQHNERFLSDLGGTVNAESFFPKVLETFEKDRAVFDSAVCFAEVGEWLTLLLTGKLCTAESTACFKRFYHPFRGYPAADYFEAVSSGFGKVLGKLKGKVLPVGACVGTLNEQMAEILGLSPEVRVAVPQVDAHAAMAAVGGKAGDLVTVMGTSGVSLLCSHSDTGMAGIYSSSAHCFLPDAYGHEGGQSSVGDNFGYFVDHFVPADYFKKAKAAGKDIHTYLGELAAKQKAGESGLLMLDWCGGVRTPLMDYSLTGALVGMTNHTRPEEIYRAHLEAVAFGAKRIKEIMENHGHKISRVFCTGGIPRKNKLFCQILADVYACEIKVCGTEDGCALGSAIQGAFTLEGYKADRLVADMCSKETESYYPDFLERDVYAALYKEYLRLADLMGGYESVMKKIKQIKEKQQ